ncbi:hypothetical protein GCM10027521_04130 [Amycolatopsis cihanbeyliensis]
MISPYPVPCFTVVQGHRDHDAEGFPGLGGPVLRASCGHPQHLGERIALALVLAAPVGFLVGAVRFGAGFDQPGQQGGRFDVEFDVAAEPPVTGVAPVQKPGGPHQILVGGWVPVLVQAGHDFPPQRGHGVRFVLPRGLGQQLLRVFPIGQAHRLREPGHGGPDGLHMFGPDRAFRQSRAHVGQVRLQRGTGRGVAGHHCPGVRHPLPGVISVDAQDLPRQRRDIPVALACGGGAAVQLGQDRQLPGIETSPLLFDLAQRGQ